MPQPRKSESQPDQPRDAVLNFGRRRWKIAGLLALATALSYLDRQSFPVVAGEIHKEIPISTEQYGYLTSLFLFAYSIMYAGGGRLLDWVGTRTGYAVMIIWWSVSSLLTGAVTSFAGLAACRFLLGMGEGGGFPGSAKAVAEIFPAKERALAFGIFNFGSSVGAVVAPPLSAVIVMTLGWRWVFYATALLGFALVWAWLKSYPSQRAKSGPRPDEAVVIAQLPSLSIRQWAGLVRDKDVRTLMLARFLSDAAGYFFIFWIPRYLSDVRGLTIQELGHITWIPYACAGLGSLMGGWLSTHLIHRDMSLDRARKTALGVSAMLMPTALLIDMAPLGVTVALFSLALFGHQFFSTNIQTVPADIFPSRYVGSVAGLLGSVGSLGGVFFSLVIGKVIGGQGYAVPFMIAGILHPLAFLVILLFVKRIEQKNATA